MVWDRRGLARSLIAFIIGLFSVSVSILLATVVYTQFDAGIAEGISDPTAVSVSHEYLRAFPLMDKMFLFVVVAYTLWLLITSFLVESHPILFGINVIVILAGIVFSAIMSNVYGEIARTPEILSATSGFTAVVPYFMSLFPYYTLVIGFVAAVIMFSKVKGGMEE